MTIDEKVKAFRKELGLYPLYLKKLDEINEKIDINFYNERNVRGIKYDNVGHSTNEQEKANKRLSLIEKGKELEKEKDRLLKHINHTKKILDMMDNNMSKVALQIYAYEQSFQDVSNNSSMFWNCSDLNYALTKEMKRVLELE